MQLVKINQESGIPLIGHIAFGIVVRPNSNLIQVRATTICNMNCIFCSTDAGPYSKSHQNHYVVDPYYLTEWIKEIVALKGETHINIDSVGEPTAYQELETLITEIRKIPQISFISMQTNGTLLTKEKILALEKAGLNRIHLSVHSFSPILSKELFGSDKYDIPTIEEIIKVIKKTKIELMFTPVWLPGINDEDIKIIIQRGKELNIPIAIQKYEEYKYSRKVKKIKKENYYKFYKQLREWEKEFTIKLIYKAEDLNVTRATNLPLVFKIGERINADIKAPGWMEGQMIAVAKKRCITVVKCDRKVGDKVNIKIIENKSNIYLAEMTR
ncbi:radical SAM protein [Candidatus Woesearchaeota archaeon]|nr:radical SAM protein [Candidatus Woesearchaeota archaeon]